ncbi:MAG: oligosaccharide flippase family protein [bacterium]|nr:MAG: oligosaccharide flippase family protein [bacterium]
MVKVEKVATAMSWSILAKVARFVAGFIATILVVRVLGDRDWGILVVLRTIIGFTSVIVMLGLGNAILKYIPAMRVSGNIAELIRTLRKLVLLQVAVWAVLLVAARYSGPIVSRFLGGNTAAIIIYLQFAVGFVIFDTFMMMVTNILQAWYETRNLAIVIIFGNIAYIILLILFLNIGWGIVGVLAAGAVINVGMGLVLLPQVGRLISGEWGGGDASPPIRQILAFSLPFVATGLLNQIVWRHSEVLFLGAFHSAREAGYFGLAYNIPQLVLEYIPLTIWPLVMAGTSEVVARNSDNLPRAINLYYKLLFLLVIPVAAMGFAFARPFVPILYGSEMLPAAILMQLFFVVFSYSFLYTPLSMALYVMEKSWVNMLVFSALAIVNVGLDLALIPRYGVWGAFFPVAIVLALGIVVFYIAVRRLRPDVTVPAAFIARCYIAAIPAAGICAVTAMRWSSLVALIVQIPLGLVLLYVGFRVFGVVGEEEKEIILKLPLPLKERIVRLL